MWSGDGKGRLRVEVLRQGGLGLDPPRELRLL